MEGIIYAKAHTIDWDKEARPSSRRIAEVHPQQETQVKVSNGIKPPSGGVQHKTEKEGTWKVCSHGGHRGNDGLVFTGLWLSNPTSTHKVRLAEKET